MSERRKSEGGGLYAAGTANGLVYLLSKVRGREWVLSEYKGNDLQAQSRFPAPNETAAIAQGNAIITGGRLTTRLVAPAKETP